jgi:hypothetical protein
MSKTGHWYDEICDDNASIFATAETAIEALNKYYNVRDLDLGVLE